jgi:hypothetical protein
MEKTKFKFKIWAALVGMTFTSIPHNIHAQENEASQKGTRAQTTATPYAPKGRPIIELPIKFYMLEFESAQELNAQTRRAQIPVIIDSLNKIYARAAIKWKLITAAPMPIKASKLSYYGGETAITHDSTTIRYRLAKAIGNITPKGEYRVYILRNFPKGESQPAYYDNYLRAVIMAENSQQWGKTHMGILAHELGIALGLMRTEASNNMMYRKRPKNADPENNKLLENQVMRLRQMADIGLGSLGNENAPIFRPPSNDNNQNATNNSNNPKSIFSR